MPLPLSRPFPDVIQLWLCPICKWEATDLVEFGRHMGKTNHGVVVVKDVGAGRETHVLMTGVPNPDDPPAVLPLPPILRDVR